MDDDLYRTFYRVQDARFPLPERSSNWRPSSPDEEFGGVCAFASLVNALDDLLGRRWDANGVCYADAVEEAGGTPVLSVFEGWEVGDDAGAGVVVDPDRSTERRFSVDEVWDAVLTAISQDEPDLADEISSWPRTPEGFRQLCDEFDLCFGLVPRRIRLLLGGKK